ncbi:WYL domain-containing transcriptional regulator [Sulfurimonas sp. NWX79]|uniref:helix-turn-helix transcriptional regulator n=1 Tax=Sulfurimonas sp. NWX79 TaxID=2925412 RepID=UPI00320461AF
MQKKDYDKTLTRLMGILTSLSENKLPKTKDLADEFNVTVRTIQKDIYQRLINFPIEKNGEGRFKFIEGFSLNKSSLTLHEMILVSLSLSQFNHVNNLDKISNNILKKLLYPNFINPYYIKQEELENLNIDSKIIKTIEKAIQQQYIITVIFENLTVAVEPYKIANFDGFWYLFAKELESNKIKTFMISKIYDVLTTDIIYKTPRAQINQTLEHTHSAWFEDGKNYEVVIKVYPEIAHYFKKKNFLQSQKTIKEFKDGSLYISFEVTHDEDIDNIIKAWLPHIEVIKPEYFKKKIIQELEQYLQKIKLSVTLY